MGLVEYMDKHGLTDLALAKRLGVSQSLVAFWRRGEKPVGAKRVLDVERITRIPRYVLRPDLYPPPKPRKARAPSMAAAD